MDTASRFGLISVQMAYVTASRSRGDLFLQAPLLPEPTRSHPIHATSIPVLPPAVPTLRTSERPREKGLVAEFQRLILRSRQAQPRAADSD